MSGLWELSQGEEGRQAVSPEGRVAGLLIGWLFQVRPKTETGAATAAGRTAQGPCCPTSCCRGRHTSRKCSRPATSCSTSGSAPTRTTSSVSRARAQPLRVPCAVCLGPAHSQRPSGPWMPWVRCRLARMRGLAHPLPGAASVPAVFPLCAADCKASEVREFTAEFLEKVLEPSGWRAVWHTNVFEVLVEVNFMPLLRLPFLSR